MEPSYTLYQLEPGEKISTDDGRMVVEHDPILPPQFQPFVIKRNNQIAGVYRGQRLTYNHAPAPGDLIHEDCESPDAAVQRLRELIET